MGIGNLLEVQGGLEKLRITAFSDEKYESATQSFVVMYNPTTFSETRSSKWLTERNIQPNSKERSFRANKSGKATFELLFDATGASPSSENKSGSVTSSSKTLAESAETFDVVTLIKNTSPANPEKRHVNDAINKFFDIAYTVDGDTHKPNYLQINWGAYEFRGVLNSATINYKLFNTSGLPIRANLTVNFAESITKEEQAKNNNPRSPDLTHYRIVIAGDTLPLIAQRIYGDSSYYIELARINNLTNFRKLTPGQKIIVPPLDKKSTAT